MDSNLILDPDSDEFKDECDVFGTYVSRPMDVTPMTYYGLYALRHRGQESAGVAVADGESADIHKEVGLITKAFSKGDLDRLKGFAAIGYIRYPTCGDARIEDAQPLLSQARLGSIAMAYNGILINADVIRELLEDGGHVFHTSIDSEAIANLIARGAKKGVEKAIYDSIQAMRGSLAMVILTKDKFIGVRGPHGIKPLCFGKTEGGYMLSSESCALDTMRAELIRDIKPGEMIIMGDNEIKSYRCSKNTQYQICAFEHIYFARPDLAIDGLDIHESRVRAGEQLFRGHKIDVDAVVAIPDSGIPSTIGYSKVSGIPYDTGFVKNGRVGKAFIAPSQEIRERTVAVKLSPPKSDISGGKVVLVDDLIVRGTASKHLVDSLRRAGVKKAYLLTVSPMVKFPCYFGVDTPHRSELIRARRSIEEVREVIGCDSLGYLSIEGIYSCFRKNCEYCVGCLNGVYPVTTPVEGVE